MTCYIDCYDFKIYFMWTVAALGYIFRGGQWEDVFWVLIKKKKKSESCGLHDFFIIKFFIIRTSKRIKDEKCYI